MAIKSKGRGYIAQERGKPEEIEPKPVKEKLGKIKRTYQIEASIPRELKIISAIKGIPINDIVESALLDYIKKNR
jgi:hypothetical protein